MPAMKTSTASGIPTNSSGTPSPTPSSAMAKNPAAIRPRQRVTSILAPAKPSIAGSSVTAASIVIATVTAAPTAIPVTNGNCMISMPSNEMITASPAKTTERPAVSIAVTVDSSGERPTASPSR